MSAFARLCLITLCCTLLLSGLPATAQQERAAMTGERLQQLIERIDPQLESSANGARFSIDEREVYLVFDQSANRMRVMTAIARTEALKADELTRMLQANFDSALDARYAIANEVVWSVYIHPLAELTEPQFASALAQVVTAAATYGGSYSSGALIYGGGDSNELHEELIRELEKRLRIEA